MHLNHYFTGFSTEQYYIIYYIIRVFMYLHILYGEQNDLVFMEHLIFFKSY